jgi:putative PIN family toxin of toxin-antitoxin system
MRIMVDTNVIISAMLKEGSVPDLVLNYACENCDLILCDHIIDESYDVANRHFSKRLSVLDDIFAKLRYELVPAPRTGEIEMRDIKDQPILNAAITYDIDVLVTGDKHFLELEIERPEIMTPSKFLEQYV